MTRNLDNELPEDKTWETDSCMNKNGCGSISRYDQSPNQRLEIGCLGSQSMILVVLIILTILWLTYSQNSSVAIISLMNNQPMSSVVLLILLILIRPLVPICYDLSP